MLKIYTQDLNVDDYYKLHSSVFNGTPNAEQIQIALDNSTFTICIKDGDKAVGMGRLIGDGSTFFYIRDVAVLPEYQGRGIGKMIISGCFNYIKENVPRGCNISVELMSAKGKEGFYRSFGFMEQPYGDIGHGMMAKIIT